MGWSIADHVRSELAVNAVQMTIRRHQPPKGHRVTVAVQVQSSGYLRSSNIRSTQLQPARSREGAISSGHMRG